MAKTGLFYKYAGKASNPLDLDDLGDVTITTPSNTEVLTYDNGTWVNSAGGSVGALNDLSDVTITSPSTDEVLTYTGAGWENAAASSANLDDGTAQGQMAFWNNSGSTWTYTDVTELFWDDTSKRLGIGDSSPSFALDIDTTAAADRKIGMGGTQVMYLPDQTDFTGSLALGNGLTNLSHSVGSEGRYNIAISIGALAACTSGINNFGAGYNALNKVTTGQDNVGIGRGAGQNATTSSYSLAIGTNSLYANTASYNVGVGVDAMNKNTSGNQSVGIGYKSSYNNLTGALSVSIGAYAGYGSGGQSSSHNVFIGYKAGFACYGDGNTLLGYQAGDNITSGDYNILIGYNVDAASATGSNQLNIGNVIKGDTSTGDIEVTGNFTQVVNTDDVSNPPTDAELDSAFGTPATVGAGYTALIDDNGAGANFYLCVSDGTNWWQTALTKAV